MLWSTFGITVCQAPKEQYGAEIIPDGAGGAIVAWTDNRSDYNGDVYAQRINAVGEVQWAVDGVAVSNTTQLETLTCMLPDGAGGAFMHITGRTMRLRSASMLTASRSGHPAVFRFPGGRRAVPCCRSCPTARGHHRHMDDLRANQYDVYTQRISGGGIPQWTIDGVAVRTDPATGGAANFPQIVPDMTGGAIIGWIDGVPYSSPNVVRAQRVDASGALLWPAGGVPVTYSVPSSGLVMETDGYGGAFMAWAHNSGLDGIRAMHLSAAGHLIWAIGGIAVGSTNPSVRGPSIVRSGDGAAIVTWTFVPDGANSTVMAQRIGGFPTGVHDTPRPVSLAVGDFVPNPFSSSTSIDITLQRASTVTIEVFDVAGRLVQHRDEGVTNPGVSRLTSVRLRPNPSARQWRVFLPHSRRR
jgi:hypothetical protein